MASSEVVDQLSCENKVRLDLGNGVNASWRVTN